MFENMDAVHTVFIINSVVMTLQASQVDMGHVVEMDDCSRVVLNARCSETFRRALQYDVYNATTSTSTTIATTSSSSTCEPEMLSDSQVRRDDVDEEQEEQQQDEKDEERGVRQTAGRRAWNRLRVYLDEQTVRRRHNNTAMNWTFVRRTLGAISQLHQSRTILYQRYLIQPDDWLNGFINCPTQLLSHRRTDPIPAAAAAASDVRRKQRMTTEH